MKNYPEVIHSNRARASTLRLVELFKPKVYAELGCYRCATASKVAELIPPEGQLHLFDFDARLTKYAVLVKHPNVVLHPSSDKLRDSYCWSLMHLLQKHTEPIFDYVYIDGAHTWDVDGFAFFLVDRLLHVGGIIEFDDYGWTLARSSALRPSSFPLTAKCYTREQIKTPQVKLVVDLLVARDSRYKAVEGKRVWQKSTGVTA